MLLTYSNCDLLDYPKKYPCYEISVSTLNQKGTSFLEMEVNKFYEDDTQQFLFLVFKNHLDMTHFKYLKHYLDTFEPKQSKTPANMKHVVFLVHKEVDLSDRVNREREFNWEIDSTGFTWKNQTSWNFVVIENLNNSYYK